MSDQEKIPSLEVTSESLGSVKELIKNRTAEADCEENYKLESIKKKPSNDRNKPPELVPFCVEVDDCNRNEDSDSPPHLFPEGILTRTKLNKTLPGGKSNIPIIDISSSPSKQSVEVECIDVEDPCKDVHIKYAKPKDKKTDHSSVIELFKGGDIFNNYKEHKRSKNISVINLQNKGKTKLKERDKLKKASERMMSPPRALIDNVLNLNKCKTVHSPVKQQIKKDTPFYMIMNDNNFTVTPCSNRTLAREHFKSQITSPVSSNMRGSAFSGLELCHSNEKDSADDEVVKDTVEILKSSTECNITFDTTKLENKLYTTINSKSTHPFHAKGKHVERNVSRISDSLILPRKQTSVLSGKLASRDINFTYTPISSSFFSRQLIDNASLEDSSLVVKELQRKMKSEEILESGSCPKSLSVSATSIKECNMPTLVKSKDKYEISKESVASNRVIRLTFPDCMTVTDSQRKKVDAISFIPEDEEEDEMDHYLQRRLQNSPSINISPTIPDGQIQIVEIDQRNISKNSFSGTTLETPVDTQAVYESYSDSNNYVKLEDKKCLEGNPALLNIKHKEDIKKKQNPNLETDNEQIQCDENYEGLSPSLEAGSSGANCLQDIKIQNITSLNSDYSLQSGENYQDTKDNKNTLVNCKNLLIKQGDSEKTLRVNTINCASWPEIEDEYEDDDEYFTVPQCVSTGKEERDVIDGVEFLSFESERDMVEFTKIQQDFWHGTSLDDGMIQSDDGLDMMDDAYAVSGDIDVHGPHQAIIPTKTNDITKIKGWRNKQFAVNDNPGSYCGFSTGSYEEDDGFESCDIKIADETNMDEDQQNHWYSEETYNNDVVDTHKDDASELKEDQNNKLSLCPSIGKSSLVNEDTMLASGTVFKPEAIELFKRLGSSTHESDMKDTKNTKNSKSAFVSDFLDSYLSSHSQLNVSYEIPKLGAEEGISYQQDLEVNNLSSPTPIEPSIMTTTLPEKQMKSKIGPKPKTLAEKRKLIELMDQDVNHQRKRPRGRPKLHSSVEPSSPLGKSTKLIEDSNKPRSLKISYPDASFLQQSNSFNLDPDYKYTWIEGRPIRITGSKICREPISMKFNTSPKKSQKISTAIEDQKPSDPQSMHLSSSVPEACNKSSNNSNDVEKEAKIKLIPDEKDERQEKEVLSVSAGNPGDETPSIENNETKVFGKRKMYGIVVSPCVGLPLHPLAVKHLKLLRHDQYVIDSIWAQFAVSVVITEMNSIKNQVPEKHVIPICSSLTLKDQNIETKCIYKDAGPNFSSSQSSLEDGLQSIQETCVQSNLISEDPQDPIQLEVRQILGDMVECVINHEIEDAIIQNDPDSQSVAPLKSPKSPKKIRQKKDKVFRELNRLDVNVIVMGEDGSGYIKDVRGAHHCEREFCRLGCICSSLQNSEPQSTFIDHCGKAECMFECSCKVKESKGYKYSEKPSLFYSTAMRLQDEGNRHLAKVEKEFRHTVIQSKNKMIVVGGGSSGDGGRRRREIKLPERYRDSSVVLGKEFAIAEFKMIASDDTNNNISSSISHSRRSDRQLNLPNYVQIGLTKSPPPKITNKTAKGKLSLKQKISLWRERYKAKPCKVNVERITGLDGVVPWCMIHLKYDCFCSGQSLKPFKKMPYRPLERPPPVPGPILESDIKNEKTTKEQRPMSRNVAVKSTTLSLNMHCHDVNRHSARTYGPTINYALRNQSQFYKYHIKRFLEESQKIINADSIHNSLYFVNFVPVESDSTHVVVPPSDVGSFGVSDESQVIPYVEESNETEDVGFAKIVSITSLKPEEFERCETINESVESDDNEDNRDNGDNPEGVGGNVNTSCEMKGMTNGVTNNVCTETLDKHEDIDIDTLPICISNVQETSSQNNSLSVKMFEVQCSNLVPILPDGDTDSHSVRLAELISMRESELKIIFREKNLSLNLSCNVAGSLQIVKWQALLDQIRKSFCHVWLHYKRGCMPKLIITATCLKPDQYCIYFDPCKQEYKAGFQGKVPPSIIFLLDQLCLIPEPSVIADCLLLNANAFGILLSDGEHWELVGTFLNDSERSEMDDIKITNVESVDSTKTLDEKVPEILKNTPELLSSMKEQETQNNREIQVVKDTTKQDTSYETENPRKFLSKNDICIIEKTDIMQHSRKPSCVKSNWKDSDQDVETYDLSEPSPDTSVLCELTGVLKSEKCMEKCDVRDSTCSDVEISVLNDDGKVIFSSLSMEITKTGNGICSYTEKAVQLESTKSSTINKVPLTEEAIKISTESSDTSKLLSTVEASESRKSDLSRSENINNSKVASGNKEGTFKAISNEKRHSQTNSEPVLSRYTANGSCSLQGHSKMNTSETANFVKIHNITGVSEISSGPEIEVPLPTGSLPGRWFMLSVENQFDLLYINNNKSLIRYSQIVRAVTLANSHGKTVRLPLTTKKEAQAYGPNHPKFGVYAVPKLYTRVFIGPYGLREEAGVNALKIVNGMLINAMENKKSPYLPAIESGEKEHALNKRMEELYDKYAHFPDSNGSCHGMWLYTRRPHDDENKNSGKSSIVMPFPLPISNKKRNVRININIYDEKGHSSRETGNKISLNIVEEKSPEIEINTVPIINETSSHGNKEMKQLAMQEGGGQVTVQKVVEELNDKSALIDKHFLSAAAAPDRLDSDGEVLDVETPCNTGELFREAHLRSQIEPEGNIDSGSTSETSITPETRSSAVSGENPFAASQTRIEQSGRSLLKKPTSGENSVGSTHLKTVRTLRPFSSNSNLVTLGKTVVAVKLVPSIPSVGYVEASMFHNKSILLKNPFTAEKEPTLFKSLNSATAWLTDGLKNLTDFMPKDLILKWRIKHKSVNIKDCKPFDRSLFDGDTYLTAEGICQPLEAHAKYERIRRKELVDGFRELGSTFLTQEDLNKTTKFRILKRALWEIENINRRNKGLQEELAVLKKKRVANFLRFCWTVRALPSVEDRKKAWTSLIRTFETVKGGLPSLQIDDSTFGENSQEEIFKTPVNTMALLKAVGADLEINELSDDDSVELEDSNDRRQAGDVKNIGEIGDNGKLIMDVPLRKKDDAVSMSIISVVGEDKYSPAKEIKDDDSVSVIRLPQTSDKLKHLSQTPFVSDTSRKLDVTQTQNQQKKSIADLNISSCFEKRRDPVSAGNSTSVLESMPSNSKGFLRISKVCTSTKQEDTDDVMVDVTDANNVQEKESTGLCFSASTKQQKRLSICVDSNQIWTSKSTVVASATKSENTDEGRVKQQLHDVLQGSDIDLRCSPPKIRVLHKKPVSELQGQNMPVPTLITLSSDSIVKPSSATIPSLSKDIGVKYIVYDETEGKLKTVLSTSSMQTGGKVNYHVFKQDRDSTVLSKMTSTSKSASTAGTSRPIPLVPRQSTISESQVTPYTLLKGVHKSSQIVPAKPDAAGNKFLTSNSFILCNGNPIYIHKPSQRNFSSVVSSQQTSLDAVKGINSFPKSSIQPTFCTVALTQKINPSLLKNRNRITFETVPVLAPSPFKVTSITKTIEASSNSQPKLFKEDIGNRTEFSLLTQRSETITRELASPQVDPENKSLKMTDTVSSPNYSVIKIDKSLLEKPTCTSLVEKHSSNSSNALHTLIKLPNSSKETITNVAVSAPSGSSCDSAKSAKEASAATKDISAVCTEETQASKINVTSLRSTRLKKEKCTSSSTSPPKCRGKKHSEMVKVTTSKTCQSKLRKKGLLKKQKSKTTSQVKQFYPTRMVTRSKIRKKYK